MFKACTEGTENRFFELGEGLALIPEVTRYVIECGATALGSPKVYYVAKCFRNETTTDATRLREFTQIGVELLGDNALDCRKVVRKDAIRLLGDLLPAGSWKLDDGIERGLNLYDASGKAFEASLVDGGRQLLGGGPYEGGAGWAIGLERIMAALSDA